MPNPADEGYVEVHDRIAEFYERFPTGSLQGEFEFRDCLAVDPEGQPFQQTLIIYCARAYRGQDDEMPGIGFASEPYPGLTPFTRNSELMNAETSAWGRALAAIGIAVKAGVASANEVRAREGTGGEQRHGFASEKQEKYLRRLLSDAAHRDPNLIAGYLEANFSGGRDGGISRAIDGLKDKDTQAETLAKLEALATTWAAEQSTTAEAPPDDDDLPTVDEVLADNGGIAPLGDEPEQPSLG